MHCMGQVHYFLWSFKVLRTGRSQKEDIGRVLTSAMRQSKFSFIALAGQPDKFTAVLMAGFRARKERVFLMLDQKILPMYFLLLLNSMLTACEHLRILSGFPGGISHCPAISTGQLTYSS